MLTGGDSLDHAIGLSASSTCESSGIDPRARIRTYPYGAPQENLGFGMIVHPAGQRWQEARTFVVREASAVIALVGGKGTSDVVQKATLAGKPVFPIPLAGGAAQTEWEKLRNERYGNASPGDIEFLGDTSASPSMLAESIARECIRFVASPTRDFSNRVFIVHGHDGELKNEVARMLSRLDLEPVILQEICDQGRTLVGKLQEELSDVGYAIILFTPDDKVFSTRDPETKHNLARQNVILEFGYLLASLGADRICGIVKGDVKLPSDIEGVVFKRIPSGLNLDSVALSVAGELKNAGYSVSLDELLS